MATQALEHQELLSVAEAARWLKAHGHADASRHRVYLALAAGRLRLAGTVRNIMLIERGELERYASEIATQR